MEVKDVNSNISSIQAMFSKAVAGSLSGQVLGSGFADLVSQIGNQAGTADKNGAVKSADKERPADNKALASDDKNNVKKEKPARKAKAVAEKAEKPAARQNERKQPAAEAASEPAAQNVAAPEAPKAADDGVRNVVEDSAAADAVVQPVEGAEPVSRELTITSLGANAPTIMASIKNGEMVLMPEAGIDAAALAQMPVVAVFDNDAGEVVTMSGAEFAAKMQQASDNGQLYLVDTSVSGKFASLIPAEVNLGIERDFSPAEVAETLPQTGAEFVDEGLAAQAQILEEKIGGDRKVKVNVEVEAENVSAADEADLVQDKVTLAEAVEAAMQNKKADSKTTEAQAPVSAQSQSAANVAGQDKAPVVPVVAAIANAEVQPAAETSHSAVVEGVSAVGAADHAVNTAVSAGVRAETRPQTTETSFKDVYKGMSREVAEQVKVNITKSAVQGVDHIEVKLKPEDLGHIEIKMQISKDGKLQAHIVASRAETMEMLQREAPELEKAFQEAGFETDAGSLSFSFRGGNENEAEQNRSAELRSFIGRALEQDNTEELAGNDNLSGWTPAQGLNIRV